MFLQVDPRTLGENLHLLIGLLLLCGVGAFVAVAISTGLTAWLGHRREERSWQERRRQRLAPDGQPYPPFIEGVCQACGRSNKRIYHSDAGLEYCPSCYDNSCRSEHRAAPPD